MMKRLTILCVSLLVVLQLFLPLSPALAQDPIDVNAQADLHVDVSISGLSANYISGFALYDPDTAWSVTIGGRNRRPRVGDTITVNGTVYGSFAAEGLADSSGTSASLAAAGAIGGTGWLAGAADPTGNLVALDEATFAVAGAGAIAATHPAPEGQLFSIESLVSISGLNAVSALTVADVSLGDEAEVVAGSLLIDPATCTMVVAESESVVQENGYMQASAMAAGDSIQDFSFTITLDRAGKWTIGGGALSAAIAGSALLDASDDWSLNPITLPSDLELVDYGYDWALRYFLCLLSFRAYRYQPPVTEWKPVGEHIVFNGLPANTRWGDLHRLEMNGVWTYVPPLKPADQLPSPVHADLMIHGYAPCSYALRICDITGSCQATRYFTVKWTGSEGVQIYDFASMSTTSPVAASPSF